MHASERRKKILEHLHRNRFVTARYISHRIKAIRTSIVTADLKVLESEGLIETKRVKDIIIDRSGFNAHSIMMIIARRKKGIDHENV
jgi:predicted transcriptional regulator